jgi:hypothetical protein
MFVQEKGDELWLGAAVPRYWLADGDNCGIKNARTYFGPMSVRWESHVDADRIELSLDPPRRNPPRRIVVRFRHPRGKKMIRCELNGRSYANFDCEKEWVVLDGRSDEQAHIVAFY